MNNVKVGGLFYIIQETMQLSKEQHKNRSKNTLVPSSERKI